MVLRHVGGKTSQNIGSGVVAALLQLILIVVVPALALGETFGLKDSSGGFTPKVSVTMSGKEIVIKKIDFEEKFKSFSIILNPKNKNLIRNVGLITIEWIDPSNKVSKSVPLAGPLYNNATHTFQDSLIKSRGIQLTEKGGRNLFGVKSVSELFSMKVEDQPLFASETVVEQDRTVRLGQGRDVSVNVNQTAITFDESNYKSAGVLEVENRSGRELTFGVRPVEAGVSYFQITRKKAQSKVPKETWGKFTVPSDDGFSIWISPDPAQLDLLNGKEIVIQVVQDDQVRETRKIPIRVAADLRSAQGSGVEQSVDQEPVRGPSASGTTTGAAGSASIASGKTSPTKESTRKETAKYSMWLWLFATANFILLAAIAIYTIFFIMPKLQVMEDRLTKNELFVHGIREAVRDEMDQLKKDLVQKQPHTESLSNE